MTVAPENADALKGKLHYSFAEQRPPGATIDAETGVFNWTPSESQKPRKQDVAVLAVGPGGRRLQTTFTIAVTPPLRLVHIEPQTVEAGKELSVVVSPANPVPGQGKVWFSLGPNAPPGANIDRQTGVFTWTPPLAEPAAQREISVSVISREGQKGQTAQTSFIITVTRRKEIALDLGSGVKLDMLLIPAGEFLMGSPDSDKDAKPDEKPQHRVRITKPFYLGKYKVTQEQWEAVMGDNPSMFKGPKNPVECVSWDDCQKFLAS